MTITKLNKPHTQVNNAGQAFFKAAAECTAEDYSHVMTTNLESSFHLCQLAHPLLVGSSIAGGGSVVHISSIAQATWVSQGSRSTASPKVPIRVHAMLFLEKGSLSSVVQHMYF